MISEKYLFNTIYREEGSDIVFIEFSAGLKVNLEVAKELLANRLQFTKNEKHYLVLDLSNVKEVSSEAKEFMQQPESGLTNILGSALIATNPVSALIANIFMKTKKDFQARFFPDKESAIDWISEHQKMRNVHKNDSF